MGVAQTLLAAVRPQDAVAALIAEYGWDLTFDALALLRAPDARIAFGLTWQRLLMAPLEEELATTAHPPP